MRKVLILLLLSVFGILYALEVDRVMLESLDTNTIEFDNYVGPYLFYNSVEEIRNIGHELASGITPENKGHEQL